MQVIPESVQNLIDELSKLPGIGPKTAQRLTFYLLKESQSELDLFGEAVLNLKKNIKKCSVCSNIADKDPCLICSDQKRVKTLICVVEEPLDIVAIEKTEHFRGLYHVLGGVISPMDGVGPDDLSIDMLLGRVNEGIEEIIIATNPNLEGEATALYLQKILSKSGTKISRLAYGLPIGADLEYADQLTVQKALEGRRLLI
jgi:recombination protein RecR